MGVTVEHWPIVVLTSGNLSEAQWAALFDEYEKVFERRERFVTLSDTSGVSKMPSATLRRLVADRAESIRPLVVRYSLGDARIVTSTMARGAMTAINWLYSHPAPVKVGCGLVERRGVVSRAARCCGGCGTTAGSRSPNGALATGPETRALAASLGYLGDGRLGDGRLALRPVWPWVLWRASSE